MDYATMADAARQREEEQLELLEAKEAATVAERIEHYMNGDGFFDMASYAMDEFDKKSETDEEFTLSQLVVAAFDSGEPTLVALSAPYYEILRRHAAKLAEEEVRNG